MILVGSRKRRDAYWLGLTLLTMMVWSACGGGETVVHTPGTPAGTYALSVTGTVTGASSNKLTHSLNLGLTVN
jgi:hypothetical protein